MKEMKYDINGMNITTFDLLFRDKDDIRECDKEEKLRNDILYIIEAYTITREESIFTYLLKKYFGASAKIDFSKIVWNAEKREYEFEYLGEKYTFTKLSKGINDIEAIKELESERRYGDCHIASINMTVGMKDYNVLTGYLNICGGRYLHSVIETPDGEIIDWTKNLVMYKDEYIKLTGFKVLESIKSDDVLEMVIKYRDRNERFMRVMSVFGKELLNDIKRNPDIFKDDEELKKELLKIREENEKQIGERD